MTEVEKLDAGLEYDFWDEGVNARKLHAIEGCQRLNAIDVRDEAARGGGHPGTVRLRGGSPHCAAGVQLRQRAEHPCGR